MLPERIALSIIVTLMIVGSSFAAEKPPPRHQDFAVTNIYKGKLAAVDLSSDPQARKYRTQLRTQTAEGPNFAGNFRIAHWGCGTGCVQLALVDCKTGRVYFPTNLPFVTLSNCDDDCGLKFRTDSKLLILRGALFEESKPGTFYFLWEKNKLKLIRSDLKK
jgi:hypothetical protein